MTYFVWWNKKADAKIADLWIASPSSERLRITQVVAAIDHLLRNDPKGQGESRGGNDRVWFAPPLLVFFEVDDSQGVVRVLGVRQLKGRN